MAEEQWSIEIRPVSEEAWERASEIARSLGEAYVDCTVTFERTEVHPAGLVNPEPVKQGFRVCFELEATDDPEWPVFCSSEATQPVGQPLEVWDVDALPRGALLARALEGAKVVPTARGMVKFEADLSNAERRTLEDRRRAQARTPTKGQPVTDEQLQHVAELYLHRVATGSRRPTQDLADMLDIPRPTVARWLVDARKRGLLSEGRRDQEV